MANRYDFNFVPKIRGFLFEHLQFICGHLNPWGFGKMEYTVESEETVLSLMQVLLGHNEGHLLVLRNEFLIDLHVLVRDFSQRVFLQVLGEEL
jgi:hypothetical protein